MAADDLTSCAECAIQFVERPFCARELLRPTDRVESAACRFPEYIVISLRWAQALQFLVGSPCHSQSTDVLSERHSAFSDNRVPHFACKVRSTQDEREAAWTHTSWLPRPHVSSLTRVRYPRARGSLSVKPRSGHDAASSSFIVKSALVDSRQSGSVAGENYACGLIGSTHGSWDVHG